MTGGGFGGCTISLVTSEHVDAFSRQVACNYKAQFGIEPVIYISTPEQGAEVLRPAG
jgi:galactokinase